MHRIEELVGRDGGEREALKWGGANALPVVGPALVGLEIEAFEGHARMAPMVVKDGAIGIESSLGIGALQRSGEG